ncbi:hypothetical protein MHU86_23020 [Fragilaria crotonensis]|nr:hypothetical protein MHU86_23020 [Fragilaria crotonensis]
MSAFHRPDTKIYGETDKTNKKTTRFSLVTYHNFSSKKTAAPTNCNPFYFQPISEDSHLLHPIVDSDDYETSSTACNASRLIQDPEAFRIPTPFSFDRHPSPFTFASETFSPLFSHFTATDGAYDCLSTTTGITNFVEAMSSDHPTDPYRLDTPFVPYRQTAHWTQSTMCPSCSTLLSLTQGLTLMPPFYITLMQLCRIMLMGQSPCAIYLHALTLASPLHPASGTSNRTPRQRNVSVTSLRTTYVISSANFTRPNCGSYNYC